MRRARRIRSFSLFFALASGTALSSGIAAEPAADPVPAKIGFQRDVRPILSENCFACHGPDEAERKARLRLDTETGLSAKRRRPTVTPGQPRKSELFLRIVTDDEDDRMPPEDTGKELTDREVEILERWIEQGAEFEKHWAYIPPTRNEAPDGKGHPVDRFLSVRQKRAGVEPAPVADRATLIRRLSLDIIGLPPTPEEVSAFVIDRSPGAYEALVDRLLASKHYGERIGLYWLDLARYADSVGYHKDSHQDVWLYRDWVIQAFNDNKPFDRFVVEQLAGDILADDVLRDRANADREYEAYELRVASGFNRLNQTTSEGGAQAGEYLVKYASDRVRNTAAIFLGSTMGCAECHDHKFDPFTMRDFYSFAAFFADIEERGVGHPGGTAMPTRAQLVRWKSIDRELERLGGIQPKPAARITELEKQRSEVMDAKRWAKTLISKRREPRETRILPRGNWMDTSGPVVEPAVPAFLGRIEREGRANRLDLAEWLITRDQPLTARVFVNRLWKLFFGRGLSRVLDDVGSQGGWPTHPELLDWLAVEFVESGWNVKHMVKTLVMSEAYRRSSSPSKEIAARDPLNELFARQARFRLAAELVRDNALAISGLLSPKMGGRSVKPYQPANYWYRLYHQAKYAQDHGEDLYRRGVYTYWRRSYWHPSLQAFDAPSREECVADRPRSNTPQQSLVLLNDPTYVEAARAFATLIVTKGGSTTEDRIRWAIRRALAREASESELAVLSRVQRSQRERYAKDDEAAKALLGVGESSNPPNVAVAELASWTAVARVLLNLHETITRS